MTPEDVNIAVGRRIAERRGELGLSLAQMAQRCGVSLQQIHKYETGQSGLSIFMLLQVARCLRAPTSYLLEPVENRLAQASGADG